MATLAEKVVYFTESGIDLLAADPELAEFTRRVESLKWSWYDAITTPMPRLPKQSIRIVHTTNAEVAKIREAEHKAQEQMYDVQAIHDKIVSDIVLIEPSMRTMSQLVDVICDRIAIYPQDVITKLIDCVPPSLFERNLICDVVVNTQPIVQSEPIVSEPIVSEPIVSEPIVSEPIVSEPIVSEPIVSEPIVSEPIVTEPIVTKPNVAEPVVSEPALKKDEDEDDIMGNEVINIIVSVSLIFVAFCISCALKA